MLYLIFWISAHLSPYQATSPRIVDGYTGKLSAIAGDSIALYLNSNRDCLYDLKLFDLSGNEVSRFTMQIFPQTSPNLKPYDQGFGYRLTKNVMVPSLRIGTNADIQNITRTIINKLINNENVFSDDGDNLNLAN